MTATAHLPLELHALTWLWMLSAAFATAGRARKVQSQPSSLMPISRSRTKTKNPLWK